MAKTTQEKTKYKAEYNEKNYARIGLYVKPEIKEEIEAYTKSRGESVSSFIKRAIDEAIEREIRG